MPLTPLSLATAMCPCFACALCLQLTGTRRTALNPPSSPTPFLAPTGALKDDSLGPVIDLHDLIIRTNQAPTWKYEPFVGSTTHMRIINKRWSDELARRHIKLLAHDADNVTIVATRANIRCAPFAIRFST